MRRVLIESPYAGNVAANVAFARECMLHSLQLGGAPFLSHLLYTQCLDDTDPAQRALGIHAGFAWGECADLVAVYLDRGCSNGMIQGVQRAYRAGQAVEWRSSRGADPTALARQAGLL